jgi:hypothetical protein
MDVWITQRKKIFRNIFARCYFIIKMGSKTNFIKCGKKSRIL